MKNEKSYRNLYTVGGISALIIVLLTLGEIIFFAFFPQPADIVDWFQLFQKNKLVGLLEFWGLELPMYLLFIPVFLSIFKLFYSAGKSRVILSTAFVLIGVGIFFATNNPFSMLSLSSRYAAAATEAQRQAALAAGQAILLNTGQRAVGGFNIALFLVSIAGLLNSTVMMKSKIFTKAAAVIGIFAFSFSLADYLRQIITQSPLIALFIIFPGALFLMIWFTMLGFRLLKLGRGSSGPPVRGSGV
jgi:hypothetical protein